MLQKKKTYHFSSIQLTKITQQNISNCSLHALNAVQSRQFLIVGFTTVLQQYELFSQEIHEVSQATGKTNAKVVSLTKLGHPFQLVKLISFATRLQ